MIYCSSAICIVAFRWPSFSIGSLAVIPKDHVQDLEVLLDSDLPMCD